MALIHQICATALIDEKIDTPIAEFEGVSGHVVLLTYGLSVVRAHTLECVVEIERVLIYHVFRTVRISRNPFTIRVFRREALAAIVVINKSVPQTAQRILG